MVIDYVAKEEYVDFPSATHNKYEVSRPGCPLPGIGHY